MAKKGKGKGNKPRVAAGSAVRDPDANRPPKPKPPMQQATQAPPGTPPRPLKPPPADPGSSGTGNTGGGQPPTQGNKPPKPKPGDRKPRRGPTNPTLAQMAKYAKKNKGTAAGSAARLAVAKGVTAGAGVGRAGSGTTAPKIVKDATTGQSQVPAGSVGYGGRSYTAENMEGLARSFNDRGLTLAQGLERNPYIAEGLGLSQGAVSSFVGARKARAGVAKAMRKSKKQKLDRFN